MFGQRSDWRTIAALLLYLTIYGLYVWKYSYPNRPFPELTLVVYSLLFPVVVLTCCIRIPGRLARVLTTKTYVLCAAFLTLGCWLMMSQINPSSIEIGRGPALNEWNQRLFSGQFPYAADTKPSGFPLLFLIATPCYLLGEVGLMQLIGLALFAWTVHHWYGAASENRFRILLLLAAAPIFAFEVCVRSDLITNATILLAAIEVTRRYHDRPGNGTPIWIGLLLGLCASTRGVFLPIYLVVLPLIFRQHSLRFALMMLSFAALGFGATLLPFALQNWKYFWSSGPFSVQMAQIPTAMLMAVLGVSVMGGFVVRTFRSAYLLIGTLLFTIVILKMLYSLSAHGLSATIEFDDYFDLAYSGFALPFVLVAMFNDDLRN